MTTESILNEGQPTPASNLPTDLAALVARVQIEGAHVLFENVVLDMLVDLERENMAAVMQLYGALAFTRQIGELKRAVRRRASDRAVDEDIKKFAGPANTWRFQLDYDKSGSVRSTLANALIAFRQAPDWKDALAFDEFANRTVLRAAPPWGSTVFETRHWTDTDDVLANEWLQHQGIRLKTREVAEAIETVARERTFHPVREYLNNLAWDDTPRLDEWTVKGLSAQDSPFVRAVGARWMISAIARVFDPGCKADTMLILEGAQGARKSTALATLGGEWFTDDMPEIGSKDAQISVAGVWIIELSELDAMSKRDTGTVKAFLSRRVDRFRPPFGRRTIDQPRQFVSAGTSNNDTYLKDESGGRRFWPVRCTSIDIDWIKANRDQLWAEAVVRYKSSEKWWIEENDLIVEAKHEQRARYVGDVWENIISEWIASNSVKQTTMKEILYAALALPKERWGEAEQRRAGRALKAVGWKRKQIRVSPTERAYVYVPDDQPGLESKAA